MVVVIEGFGELFFITKMLQIITKFVTNITGLLLEKQWGNNGEAMVECCFSGWRASLCASG